MKSRPVYKRNSVPFKYYMMIAGAMIMKYDVPNNFGFAGMVEKLDDKFEPVGKVKVWPEDEISEAAARQLAPHLFK